MAVADSMLQLKVRATLVRNWVETRMLNYNVIGGVVHMQGMLVITYEHPDFDPGDEYGVSKRALLNLERDLRRIDGVRAIHYDLTNWVHSGGEWIKRRYIR